MGLCPCCYNGRHQAGHVWYISWKCVSWRCYYYAGFLEELGFIYVWMPCRCFKFWLRPTLRTKTFAKRLAFFDHPCTAFSKHTVFLGIRAVSVHKPRPFPGRRCCNYRVGRIFSISIIEAASTRKCVRLTHGYRTDTRKKCVF